MAEEIEKKPQAVLIKKEKKTPPAETPVTADVVKNDAKPAEAKTTEKKKIVVKAKSSGSAAGSKEIKKTKVVVKKTTAAENKPADNKLAELKSAAPKTEEKKVERKPVERTTFEINSSRPNVKAGNLSGGPKNRYGNNGNRGGFTGAQAREGFQNRGNNFQNGGGYQGNRQGINGYQGNRQGGNGYQGNRQGGNGGRPGFNGSRPNGGNFQGNRPGLGNKPGFGSKPGFGGGFSAVPPMEANKGPAKKAFKGKKQVYNRKDQEQAFDEGELYKNKKEVTPASAVPSRIDIMESITVSDLAKKMNLKASEIIGKLMGMGMMCTINQAIDSDTATIVASEYNCEVHLISLYDETVIESDEGSEEGYRIRPPIVTVMGHVDHGKTKTLDAIRNADVAAGEAGGITQKIGAYQVHTERGDITFLDTPGHEAFTMMRARGAQITDIVVLVVAADDGVMPQTLEAINHAKDAKVPIIVAVNKCDKPDAKPENVMTQLANLDLTPEEWGGETQFVNISALKHQGIDELLDAILIQAEVLELKAQYDCRAEGKVIESRTDQGRGVVASIVIERGTLHVGDPLVAGIYSGRVRAIFDDHGNKVQEAGPSMPVEVLGLENMPNAGDPIQVTESEKDARAFAAKRQELKRFEAAKAVKKITLDNMFAEIDDRKVEELKLIIKADLQGSAEALKTSLEKLSTKEIRVNVIHSSAGAINESDVTLAAADQNAIIIGFNVRPTPKAKALADQEKVEIRKYNIIYKCVEEIQQAMEGMLSPDTKEETTGTLEVRSTFRVPKVGVIAGCYVTDGVIRRNSSVNVIRDGVVIFTGKVASLKHFKDDAKEMKAGYECGVGIENWQDLKEGDQLEAFEYVNVARKLGETLAEAEAKAEKQAAYTGESAAQE